MINPIDMWFINNAPILIMLCGIFVIGCYLYNIKPKNGNEKNWTYKKKSIK